MEWVVVYQRPQGQVVLNCIRLCKLRITVPSIVNEAKHKIIIILLSIFLIWCLFTIVTTMTTNEKQYKTISSYKWNKIWISNSLLNVSKGTTCKRLYNKEIGYKRHFLSLLEFYKLYKLKQSVHTGIKIKHGLCHLLLYCLVLLFCITLWDGQVLYSVFVTSKSVNKVLKLKLVTNDIHLCTFCITFLNIVGDYDWKCW